MHHVLFVIGASLQKRTEAPKIISGLHFFDRLVQDLYQLSDKLAIIVLQVAFHVAENADKGVTGKAKNTDDNAHRR